MVQCICGRIDFGRGRALAVAADLLQHSANPNRVEIASLYQIYRHEALKRRIRRVQPDVRDFRKFEGVERYREDRVKARECDFARWVEQHRDKAASAVHRRQLPQIRHEGSHAPQSHADSRFYGS